ncbi:6162_t:CDS:2 [Entrophospora sp. SA101]|nr:15777_t:CDS:2 [Entrophospora sp. SA101]CAJ0637328.1 14293_t:CDS:2 [Entrophospora sp. SA101]CAJ0747909.1 419_t:CDS:2 [Entrophospora sp. SA101]CAJ0757145.1 6162_t:CDS:2 [Entrophospora sp. SA101]CAJ0836215.1 10928_t:CDS:2 [Entrophospora sp. SA101]
MSFSLTKSLLKRTNLHKNLLQTRRASGGHGHEPEFNEPSGYLFGEKPPPPGQKRVKEDWENYWYYGMGGSLLLGTIIYFYKPDTSVNTWATKEAEKRLQERNVVLDYPKTEKKL